LNGGQSSLVYDSAADGIPDEHPYLLNTGWDLRHNLLHNLRVNVPGALFVEDETQRVGTRVDCRQGIFQIGDSTNLDPGHKPSSQFLVESSQKTGF
jgi:hypothetical protein